MITLFTDFGLNGPYVGQMKAVLAHHAPDLALIDLFHAAPAFDPKRSAYLLSAFTQKIPEGSVFLCVVDPGVGGDRRAGVLNVGRDWFVGPDNGLFELVMRRSREPVIWWDIVWQPDNLSSSFHGRDIFAPVAARLANGEHPEDRPDHFCRRDVSEIRFPDFPDELDEIIFIDDYGNAMSGRRTKSLAEGSLLKIDNVALRNAGTFSNVPPGTPFWYGNSSGLVEIAVNQGRADEELSLSVGKRIEIIHAT